MSPTHTAESLAALINAEYEPDNAERVLEALRPLDGKPITARLLDALPGGRVEWRLSRHMGWTEITNRAYRDSKGDARDGLTLHLAHSEASVPLDVAWVERENARYFEGRRQRNALRRTAMSDTHARERLAVLMNEIEDLNHKLAFARGQFTAVTNERNSPFWPERYELERACGLREVKK